MDPRVRAPRLRGRGWLNTGGTALSLEDLRGRIVLLDFWTFCCVNCLHVLDELRPLEQAYADVLVTIGVHSPKFEHEKVPAAVAAAVRRYGIAHPVLDDPELITWRQYAARAWPTLVVIDPQGYVVATLAGEGHAAGLAALIDELIEVHGQRGTLRRGDTPYVPPPPSDAPLDFPGKALALPGGGFLVSSSAAHQLVELAGDLATVQRRIGSGARGRADGGPGRASFNEPNGLLALPPRVAELVGYDLVVADTVNHLLRGVRTGDGTVATVAGSGRPAREPAGDHPHDALSVDLSSPWDLAWYDDQVIVAMAGVHQLWWFDPVRRTAGVYAGTTVEALRDGPLEQVWMAQPSGLSVATDRLWIADAESSALRYVRDAQMGTAVGQGLFDFGLVDGPAELALLQHPLGVLARADGTVLVADTYNGAVRLLRDGTLTTVATGLAEPSDLVEAADGTVVVVESAAHRLVRLDPAALDPAALDRAATGTGPPGVRMRTERPVTVLAPGTVTLDVLFTPPPGQKLDHTFGTPTRLEVSASPPELLRSGGGTGGDLRRVLDLDPAVPAGVLQVVAQAATCDADSEHGACHLTRQDWGVPVRIAANGTGELRLALVDM